MLLSIEISKASQCRGKTKLLKGFVKPGFGVYILFFSGIFAKNRASAANIPANFCADFLLVRMGGVSGCGRRGQGDLLWHKAQYIHGYCRSIRCHKLFCIKQYVRESHASYFFLEYAVTKLYFFWQANLEGYVLSMFFSYYFFFVFKKMES